MKLTSRILLALTLTLGAAAVTACSDDDGGTDTVSGKAISSIDINGDLTMDKGTTQQETVTVHYADGTTLDATSLVQWNVGDTGVATVSSTGLVTAVGVGTTTVKATYQGKESDEHRIIVH